jgi:DNA-binding IclR family transcriptional regulator
MQNKPVAFIESVDHALRLSLLLQQEGNLRVSDAAKRLGVARSTAHRLLSMLVYRGFAEQGDDRSYSAGLALRHPFQPEATAELRTVALPHLRSLMETVGETTYLCTVVGNEARFVATVECAQVLRVGRREGRTLPAHLTAAGRAVLAAKSPEEIFAIYAGADTSLDDINTLVRELRSVRRQGFALNNQRTETGITAIGRALHNPDGTTTAGISIAMPTVRYRRARLLEWAHHLAATTAGIEHDLTAKTAAGSGATLA